MATFVPSLKVSISPLEMTLPDGEEILDKERLAVEATGGEDKADFDGATR